MADSKVASNNVSGMLLLVQFIHRFAFTLIRFRQYLHFTVCLMMGSSDANSAMLASAYRAQPTPTKLMILLRKVLRKHQSRNFPDSINIPVSHHHGAIGQRLAQSIVPVAMRTVVVVSACPQHGELLLHVAVNEGQEGERREQDVRHERRDHSSKSRCQAIVGLELVPFDNERGHICHHVG